MSNKKLKNNPNLIGISGKIGSGKDTVGEIIRYLISYQINGGNWSYPDGFKLNIQYTESKWEIKKFADKLKDIVCLLIGCTREQLEDREFKEKELGEDWDFYEAGEWNERFILAANIPYDETKYRGLIKQKMTPRLMLQLLGTEAGRNIIHPNIWCNSLFSDFNGDIEQWVDIKGYEGLYQVSSFGNVKSLDREVVYGEKKKGEYHNRKGQILKPTLSGGYKTVSLSSTTYTVHSLVAKHFLEFIDGDYVVNHIDYDKTNNFYKNLEYVTQGDNVRHNYVTGNANIGTKQKDAKLNDDGVLEIKKLLGTNLSQAKIAKQFGVSPTTITDIKKGRKWKHVGKEKIEIKPILPTSPPDWIITDVRFENEAQAVKEKGGIMLRVNRDTMKIGAQFTYKDGSTEIVTQKEHPSETRLDDYEFDHVIDNNGSIEELVEKVKQLKLV